MTDVNEIRLVRPEKTGLPQLFLNIFYAARNNNRLVVGEIKSCGTIVAFAIQNILHPNKVDGVDGV